MAGSRCVACAAGTLAAVGDRAGLEKIEDCVERGLVPAVEAIGYFGMGPSELGATYIEKYLASGPKEAKVAAVGYLGTDPSYQSRIRDLLVLDESDVEEEVLQKAAAVLGPLPSRVSELCA